MQEKINQIRSEYLGEIESATDLKTLDELFLSLFGKNGEITLLPKDFAALSKEEKQKIGPLFNQVKIELESAIENKRQEVREVSYKRLEQESFAIDLKAEFKQRKGHLHPITQFDNEIALQFEKLGFQRFEAPLMDTDYNNFQVLNIPEDHPARDLQDTLYIDPYNLGSQPGKLLLRTHTSNSQIHIMKNFKLPIRIMNIGRVFRNEAVDSRHDHTFEHFELIYIDKGLNMGNLQYLSEYLLKAVFGEDIKARLKPKYYPFVEPGAGIDGTCIFCKGKGCKVCGLAGWLELGGAGMIHPTVLKNGGIDPNIYSGIAWGLGRDRFVMLKHGINDLRLLRSGDLKFLESLQ